MDIVIIGTGNVATVLGRLCKEANYRIAQVYGRRPEAAASLAIELDCSCCSEWNEIKKDADIYIAALSDRAIAEMASRLNLNKGIIVHTAGAVSIQVLKTIGSAYGILYPLQSIRKDLPPAAIIPLLIDGCDDTVKRQLFNFALGLSPSVTTSSDDERARLHVAAVMVNNFTNHLYRLAEAFCKKEMLDFKLLQPLIQESASRLQFISPAGALTGPAIRKDQDTINKHLELLEKYPQIKNLYQQITASIQSYND